MIRKILMLLAIPLISYGQNTAQKADELITAYANLDKFSGNVLIAEKGKVIFQKSYGFADLQSKKLNTAETEFRAGSLTKMFTSTLILQLVNQNKLKLDEPVSKYVSGIPEGDKIKIIHLLSHTSGIKGNINPLSANLQELVEQYKYEKTGFEPGSQFEYNNFNYMLLSYIAEKVSGINFSDLMHNNIFKKASMIHSGMDDQNRISDNKATGYVIKPSTLEWVPAQNENVSLATGAGALYTTTGDLLEWSKSLTKNTVLPDSTFLKAWTPAQGEYGLGWIVKNKNGRMAIGHTGSIQGYLASFMKYPKEDITIIFLCNYGEANGRQILNDLEALVFNEPYTLPTQKKEIILPAEVLNKYAGEYETSEKFKITLSVEKSKLYGLAQGDAEKMEFTPQSETKFFLKGTDIEVEFIFENNELTHMLVHMGGVQKFKKVK